METREAGELAQRRRQKILAGCLMLMFFMQAVALQAAQRIATGQLRAVDVAQLIAPILLAAGLLRGFFGPPLYVSSHARRAAIDELTAENRHRALAFGFVVTIAMCAILCVALPFVALSGIETGHLVLAVAMGSTVFRFVLLERRGGDLED